MNVDLDQLVKATRRRKRNRLTFSAVDLAGATPQAVSDNPNIMLKRGARVLGPYANGDKWRLVVLDGAARKSVVCDSQERALELRAELQRTLTAHVGRPIGEAMEEYLLHQAERGLIRETVQITRRHLSQMLPLGEPLTTIGPERAQALYDAQVKRVLPGGKPLSPSTHQTMLKRVKLFFRWAISRRYLKQTPFAEVKAEGRVRCGKTQFRIDEARALVEHCLEGAARRETAPTALLMQIYLGLRPTEAVIRQVRDLDDGGRVLWIPFGKTLHSKRRLRVPEPLSEILRQHAEGKPPEAALLGPLGEPVHSRQILNKHLPKLCEAAGVPRVCPHSLRGLNATLALEAGATAQHVAAALGHARFSTTARHYADGSTLANAQFRRVAGLLRDSDRSNLEPLAHLLQGSLTAAELRSLGRLLGLISVGGEP